MKKRLFSISVALLLANPLLAAQPVPVPQLAAAPAVDGDSGDWGGAQWHKVDLKPAVEDDSKNFTGEITVDLAVGQHEGNLYVAARWPDEAPDEEYLPWVWKGNKYRKGKSRDDLFAIRFDMGGDFNECMIAEVDYKVDVWLWSAGRSNPTGYAEDMWHSISVQMTENAAEYEGPTGKIVYIIKRRDDGEPIYKTNRIKRKKKQGKKLPGIVSVENPSGSVAEVRAKGVWKDGFWTLEMSRKMDTGNADDTALKAGTAHRTQIAVFNKGNAEHKSMSETLEFQF